MQRDEFKRWMMDRFGGGLTAHDASSRAANCARVELFENCDLDREYGHDRCEGVLSRLSYTKKEKEYGVSARHNIPIKRDLLTGSAALSKGVMTYVRFRDANAALFPSRICSPVPVLPLKKRGGLPNDKSKKRCVAKLDSSKAKNIVRALDDLDWMMPGSFKIKKHQCSDWIKKFRRVECREPVGVATWLQEFDRHLMASGYASRMNCASAEVTLSQSAYCSTLYQRVVNTADRDTIDDFDAQDRQWIQFALDHLARAKPGETFLDLTSHYIDDVFEGDKLEARLAACIDRRTFSSMFKVKGRGVSKRTALQLAFAFELSSDDAMDYLASAGIALKPYGEDRVYKICFERELYDFDVVNYLLSKQGYDPLVDLELRNPQT